MNKINIINLWIGQQKKVADINMKKNENCTILREEEEDQ